MVQYFGDVPAEISSSAMAIISGYKLTCTQTKLYNLDLIRVWVETGKIRSNLKRTEKNRFFYVVNS